MLSGSLCVIDLLCERTNTDVVELVQLAKKFLKDECWFRPAMVGNLKNPILHHEIHEGKHLGTVVELFMAKKPGIHLDLSGGNGSDFAPTSKPNPVITADAVGGTWALSGDGVPQGCD